MKNFVLPEIANDNVPSHERVQDKQQHVQDQQDEFQDDVDETRPSQLEQQLAEAQEEIDYLYASRDVNSESYWDDESERDFRSKLQVAEERLKSLQHIQDVINGGKMSPSDDKVKTTPKPVEEQNQAFDIDKLIAKVSGRQQQTPYPQHDPSSPNDLRNRIGHARRKRFDESLQAAENSARQARDKQKGLIKLAKKLGLYDIQNDASLSESERQKRIDERCKNSLEWQRAQRDFEQTALQHAENMKQLEQHFRTAEEMKDEKTIEHESQKFQDSYNKGNLDAVVNDNGAAPSALKRFIKGLSDKIKAVVTGITNFIFRRNPQQAASINEHTQSYYQQPQQRPAPQPEQPTSSGNGVSFDM